MIAMYGILAYKLKISSVAYNPSPTPSLSSLRSSRNSSFPILIKLSAWPPERRMLRFVARVRKQPARRFAIALNAALNLFKHFLVYRKIVYAVTKQLPFFLSLSLSSINAQTSNINKILLLLLRK